MSFVQVSVGAKKMEKLFLMKVNNPLQMCIQSLVEHLS